MQDYVVILNGKAKELFQTNEDLFSSVEYEHIMEVLSNVSRRDDVEETSVLKFINWLVLETNKLVTSVGVTYDVDDFIINGLPEDITNELDSLDLSNIYESNEKVNELYKRTMEYMYDRGSHVAALPMSRSRGDLYAIGCSFLAYGYRLNSDSVVQDKFVRESLFDGFGDSVEAHYNSALSSRNALLQAVNAIPDSGYIYRKLSLLLSNSSLVHGLEYCGTKTTIGVDTNVTPKEMFYGRHSIDTDGSPSPVLNESNIDEYIGDDGMLNLFTPIFCQAPGKNHCVTCIGDHSKGLKGYSSTGIFSAMEISEKTTQTLLSSRHLQFLILSLLPPSIRYGVLTYNHEDKNFTLDRDITLEELDLIRNYQAPFLDYVFVESMTKGQPVIIINDNRIKNIDMNSMLAEFKRMIECHVDYSGISDVGYFLGKVLEFKKMSGLRVDPVHFEIMLASMCRLDSDPSKLAKESIGEPYTVVGLSGSLLHKNNAFDLLLFERVRETLSNFSRFNKENDFSEIENFFINGALQ